MASALDTLTKLIQSPPGVVVAGGALAGIVWKFFERVEAVLTDQTKLEIAVWLLGVKVGQTIEPWPETFAKVFNRVFGAKHLSWRCFYRSTIYSMLLGALGFFVAVFSFYHIPVSKTVITLRDFKHQITFLAFLLAFNVAPDYLSLLETRLVLKAMIQTRRQWLLIVLLLADLVLTASMGVLFASPWIIWAGMDDGEPFWEAVRTVFDWELIGYVKYWLIYPAMFTSIWLWLYAGSGFLLKAAHRFDLGFDWFNRKFDIEKHPLSSIGLVAGAIVAVVYWAAVGIRRSI